MKKDKWVLIRDSKIIGSFNERFEGIEHLNKMLRQTIKDLKEQNKPNSGFDYNVNIPKIELYRIEIRPAYLGL